MKKEWLRTIGFVAFVLLALVGLRYWRVNSVEASLQELDIPLVDSIFQEPDTVQIDSTTMVEVESESAVETDSSAVLPERVHRAVMECLASGEMSCLEAYLNPEIPLLFSPYAYIDSSNLELPESFFIKVDTSRVFEWGHFDGSGEPIKMNFVDYHKRFIYDVDFLNDGEFAVNESLHGGNSLNNLEEVFPDAQYVTYYKAGTEKYAEMDWKVLRLVFQPIEDTNEWILIAIVHDEWTI